MGGLVSGMPGAEPVVTGLTFFGVRLLSPAGGGHLRQLLRLRRPRLVLVEGPCDATALLSDLAALGVRSSGAPRAAGTESERVVLSPDMLWSDHAEGIELKATSATQTVTLYPEVSVSRYTVEIHNAENLKYVSGISGSISSLAGGLLAGKAETTEECVTIPFDATFSPEQHLITGQLLAFGHCPSMRNRHQLTVYAVLADQSRWYYTYDVTDQIHSAPNQRDVHIVLDGLPLPKPIVNGGGFQPTVEEWQEIPIDIEM